MSHSSSHMMGDPVRRGDLGAQRTLGVHAHTGQALWGHSKGGCLHPELQPPGLEENKSLLFEGPMQGYFIMAAPAG